MAVTDNVVPEIDDATKVLREMLIEKSLREGDKELFLKVTSPNWYEHYITDDDVIPDYEQDLRLDSSYATNVIADSQEDLNVYKDLIQDFIDRHKLSNSAKEHLKLFKNHELLLEKTKIVYSAEGRSQAVLITPMSVKVVAGYSDENNIQRALNKFIDSDEPIYLILQSEEDLEVAIGHQVDAYYGPWATGRRDEEIYDTTVAEGSSEVHRMLRDFLDKNECSKEVKRLLNTVISSKKMLKKTKIASSPNGRNCVLTISKDEIKVTGSTYEGIEALKYFAKYAETMFIILED